MNLKIAKRLREMAHQMHKPDQAPVRRLMVHPAHERRAKAQGSMRGITAVNDPRSWRGIYRWLKRNYANA